MTGKRGRPRVDEPGSPVTAWLRQGDHDALIRLAKRDDRTVSAVIRDLVKRTLPANKPTV